MRALKVDKLQVEIYENRTLMGEAVRQSASAR